MARPGLRRAQFVQEVQPNPIAAAVIGINGAAVPMTPCIAKDAMERRKPRSGAKQPQWLVGADPQGLNRLVDPAADRAL